MGGAGFRGKMRNLALDMLRCFLERSTRSWIWAPGIQGDIYFEVISMETDAIIEGRVWLEKRRGLSTEPQER